MSDAALTCPDLSHLALLRPAVYRKILAHMQEMYQACPRDPRWS